MSNYIKEIEFNSSNACLANCIFCSRPHGVGNRPFMMLDTFGIFIEQLKDIKCDIIQTSGNGETFLNPYYLEYMLTLKKQFPHIPRWIYNNFSLLDKNKADIIVRENLFDKIHVRIDSLQKWVFERNSNLNFELVVENLKYFMGINTKIPLTVLYNDINVYYNKCKKILNKRPIRDYYTDEELKRVLDEYEEVKDYFSKLSKAPIAFCKINPCLWGERLHAPKNSIAKCPKIEVIKNVIWLLPNGDVTGCCYDDTQDKFILGNIHNEHLLTIFNSDKRKEFIKNIENRVYKEYPCTNPLCCGFSDGMEKK